MSKEEFLKTLRKRLNILEDSEIEDIISEYEGYIDEKVNTGLSEAEAIKELGDIDEIISDLLAAYKVKEPQKESSINNVINKISNAIDNFMSSLDDKSAKDIIRILIEVIIILLAIWLLKIPFAMIRDLGESIFYEVHNPIGNILSSIWWIVIETSYIIVAVIFFFKMFEKRYFKNVSTKIMEEVDDEYQKEKKRKDNSKENPSEETTLEEKNEIKAKNEEKEKAERKEKTKYKENTYKEEAKKINRVVEVKNPTFVDTLTSICILILKIFAVFFVIGTICYLIGTSIALGIMIYLLSKGVTYFGILILLIALFMGGAFILKLLINFLFNKKIKAYHVFGELISCIIVLAIGLSLSAIEISNTEIIYDNSYVHTKTITKELPLNSNKMPIYNYDNLIIDNNIKDKVRIEYEYPNINDLNIEIDLENCGSGYCLHSDLNYFKWNKKVLDYLVEHLKDKKIYTYDFRITKNIYVNKEDINKIKGNKYYYNNDYEDKNKTYTFTKNFEVLNIAPSHTEEYLYLTLRDPQGKEVETVKVLRNLASNVEINKNYEFTFNSNDIELDDDIDDIFEKSNLINIKSLDETE